jgi:hypothetical protein
MVSTMRFSKKRNSVNMESNFLTKRQDSRFEKPQAARQGITKRCSTMTKLQDSSFAQPQAARQGSAQGCAL